MRYRSINYLSGACAIGMAMFAHTSVHADYWAAEVLSYDTGEQVERFSSYYDNPGAVLGAPPRDTGPNFPITPLNNPWSAGDIASIGIGGHLTLQLDRYVLTDVSGPHLGVFVQQQFQDEAFPSGITSSPVSLWYPDQRSMVEVSVDGQSWVALDAEPIEQNIPINAFQDVDATQLADYRMPFEGELSDYDGRDGLASVLAVTGESGGGNWHDLSSTGLDEVGFVRFSVPEDAQESFQLVAVSIADGAAGAVVPEPASLVLLAAGAMTLAMRRQRRTSC